MYPSITGSFSANIVYVAPNPNHGTNNVPKFASNNSLSQYNIKRIAPWPQNLDPQTGRMRENKALKRKCGDLNKYRKEINNISFSVPTHQDFHSLYFHCCLNMKIK